MRDIRLLVSGGRTFDDDRELDRVLSAVHAKFGIAYLIQGEAPGADTLAKGWAHSKKIAVSDGDFKANWDLYGNRAGLRRNQLMLDDGRPDFAVCFPGGDGTADMRRRLVTYGNPFMWAKAHPVIAMGVPVRPIYEWIRM